MPKRRAGIEAEDYEGFFNLLSSIPNRKDVTIPLQLAPNAITLWIKRKSIPSGDIVLKLAKLMKSTVEEILLGEKGRKYILKWAEENGARWKPPPRMVPLIDVAEKLTDTKLIELIEIAKVLSKNENTEIEPRSVAN